jgi:hypothetical protein
MKDESRVIELIKELSSTVTVPGYMSLDEANRHFAAIRNLFPGVESVALELALAAWCIVNDVGGTQNFDTKPPIECGGYAIPATSVFGAIVPTGVEGKARQFAATKLEDAALLVLKHSPEVRVGLGPRLAEAGLSVGQEAAVVSFLKGGRIGAQRAGTARIQAKHASLSRNGRIGQPMQMPVTEVSSYDGRIPAHETLY